MALHETLQHLPPRRTSGLAVHAIHKWLSKKPYQVLIQKLNLKIVTGMTVTGMTVTQCQRSHRVVVIVGRRRNSGGPAIQKDSPRPGRAAVLAHR